MLRISFATSLSGCCLMPNEDTSFRFLGKLPSLGSLLPVIHAGWLAALLFTLHHQVPPLDVFPHLQIIVIVPSSPKCSLSSSTALSFHNVWPLVLEGQKLREVKSSTPSNSSSATVPLPGTKTKNDYLPCGPQGLYFPRVLVLVLGVTASYRE